MKLGGLVWSLRGRQCMLEHGICGYFIQWWPVLPQYRHNPKGRHHCLSDGGRHTEPTYMVSFVRVVCAWESLSGRFLYSTLFIPLGDYQPATCQSTFVCLSPFLSLSLLFFFLFLCLALCVSFAPHRTTLYLSRKIFKNSQLWNFVDESYAIELWLFDFVIVTWLWTRLSYNLLKALVEFCFSWLSQGKLWYIHRYKKLYYTH